MTTYDRLPANPVRFQASIEQPEKDEAETVASLSATMSGIREKTFADTGHATRSVHAKCHGVLTGELEVLPGLPDVLAQGLFGRPGRYPVAMRLSTPPGDILDDSVTLPRGMAIKVMGVTGPRLPGSEGDATQDFLLVNGPVFTAPNARGFARSLKAFAATTGRAEGAKKMLSAVNRGTEALIETFGLHSTPLNMLGGHQQTHPLGDTFYSQAPILYGDYIAKVSIAPVSPELAALTDAKLDLLHDPNAMRQAVRGFFSGTGGTWELRVQLCTDIDTMPVEDAGKRWDEKESPYLPVARITVPPQDSYGDAAVRAVDERLSFNPWHGLAAHRPLGSVMRARKTVYQQSVAFRAEKTGCPFHEPASLAELQDTASRVA